MMELLKKIIAIAKNRSEMIGNYIKRYSVIYIVLMGVIAILEVFFMSRLIPKFASESGLNSRQWGYFICYIVLFVSSILGAIAVILVKKNKISSSVMCIILHIYAMIIIAWGTTISILDLSGDGTPIVFLTVIIVIGGAVVINPILYCAYVLIAYSIIMSLCTGGTFQYFAGASEYLNVGVFVIMALIVAYRNFRVSISEEKNRIHLHALSFTDTLTGLDNENSYYRFIDELEKDMENDKRRFVVLSMDLNGVKAVDDTYGHRFGARMIEKVGEILPIIFPNSKSFHIGGDEFVTIVEGYDFEHFATLLRQYDKMLVNQKFTFENVELPLSVARGYAFSGNGRKYAELYQIADDKMYENKKEIKELYNISER